VHEEWSPWLVQRIGTHAAWTLDDELSVHRAIDLHIHAERGDSPGFGICTFDLSGKVLDEAVAWHSDFGTALDFCLKFGGLGRWSC
jgi:hypothetical protein